MMVRGKGTKEEATPLVKGGLWRSSHEKPLVLRLVACRLYAGSSLKL